VREETSTTILCVGNRQADCRALAGAFRAAGFEVAEAATGTEALALAMQRPAFVLLVVHPPDVSGFEVCRQIKSHPATAALPVLFLFAAGATPAEKSRARAEGASGCLVLPVDSPELVAQTTALLRTLAPGLPARPPDGEGMPERVCRSGLTKAEAEKVLDWLEANGCRDPEVDYKDGEGFSVRWPAGPDAGGPQGPGERRVE
jgi:DNA-binding response OmpR family regulator